MMSITVSKLHNDRIMEIINQEAELPELEKKLDLLRVEFANINPDYEIIKYKDLKQQIEELTKSIENIKSQRINYFKRSGQLLHRYIELDNQPRKVYGLESLKKKQTFKRETSKRCHTYRTLRSSIDPDYVYIDEDVINDENYCYKCERFLVAPSDEAIMICPKCGMQITVTSKPSKPSINDGPVENTAFEYKRNTHFIEWIENIQGKESFVVPDNVIELVKKEVHRTRMDNRLDELTEEHILKFLKKHRGKKYDRYYHHCTQILYKITGITPKQMTPGMESNLKNLFMAIQEPFELYKDKRHNFSSYGYILYKFCELLGYKDFMCKFHLHKNLGKIYEHDQIWKKICQFMGGESNGWVFIKSYEY